MGRGFIQPSRLSSFNNQNFFPFGTYTIFTSMWFHEPEAIMRGMLRRL